MSASRVDGNRSMRGARDALAFALALTFAGCGEPDVAAPPNGADVALAKAEAPRPGPPAAPDAPRTAPWSPTGYALNGTAPFWGASLTGTRVRYMVPEDQFGDVIETRAAFAADRETYTGSYRGRPFVLTLSRGPCSDGLSDRTYSFAAELRVRGETRRGCADPQ